MNRSPHLTAYRSVFISDLHLGARECQAELLLDFLRHMVCDRLYLVGDIVDGWRMKRGWRWPPAHHAVVREILALAAGGAQVTYIPGNHDDRLADFCGRHFGDVIVTREADHETADGRRMWVVHGDMFDPTAQRAPWLARAGDLAYKALIATHVLVNRVRGRLGLDYWNFAGWLKGRLSANEGFVTAFETAAAAEARARGFDGVICGHIHNAAAREVLGVAYFNDGDWVESCTALVERDDGRLDILAWAKAPSWSMIGRARRVKDRMAPTTEPAIA